MTKRNWRRLFDDVNIKEPKPITENIPDFINDLMTRDLEEIMGARIWNMLVQMLQITTSIYYCVTEYDSDLFNEQDTPMRDRQELAEFTKDLLLAFIPRYANITQEKLAQMWEDE